MSYSEVENNRKRYYWNEVLLSFNVNEYCGQNSESQINAVNAISLHK